MLICSMISCPGETVRTSQKKRKEKKGDNGIVGLSMEGSLCFELLIRV